MIDASCAACRAQRGANWTPFRPRFHFNSRPDAVEWNPHKGVSVERECPLPGRLMTDGSTSRNACQFARNAAHAATVERRSGGSTRLRNPPSSQREISLSGAIVSEGGPRVLGAKHDAVDQYANTESYAVQRKKQPYT